ncbi:MAG: hypothetical protein M1838_003352 [Thelocarpon superellum]|nr:MAG: hypothetical protein M1838_003352 [Thelocarpon superellum]
MAVHPIGRACVRMVTELSPRSSILPLPFLVPALHGFGGSRCFSQSRPAASHYTRTPLSLPPEVTFQVLDPPLVKKQHGMKREAPRKTVELTGPLGQLKMELPPFVQIEEDMSRRKLTIKVEDATIRHQREMWGTTRAYLQNHILGVSEGHTAILRLVGVGYRASVEPTATTVSPAYPGQQFVSLRVGYSHPIELGVPLGVKASTPQPTRILLEGMEKVVVNQFAAEIRMWRKPEPYKGKGIFVNGETITLKAKKIK